MFKTSCKVKYAYIGENNNKYYENEVTAFVEYVSKTEVTKYLHQRLCEDWLHFGNNVELVIQEIGYWIFGMDENSAFETIKYTEDGEERITTK